MVDHGDRLVASANTFAKRANSRQLRAIEQHRNIEIRQLRAALRSGERRVLSQEVEALRQRIRVDDVHRLAHRAQQLRQRCLGTYAVTVRILVTSK